MEINFHRLQLRSELVYSITEISLSTTSLWRYVFVNYVFVWSPNAEKLMCSRKNSKSKIINIHTSFLTIFIAISNKTYASEVMMWFCGLIRSPAGVGHLDRRVTDRECEASPRSATHVLQGRWRSAGNLWRGHSVCTDKQTSNIYTFSMYELYSVCESIRSHA